MRIALVSFIFLAGCIDWPDTGNAPSLDEIESWPTLKPIGEIFEPQSAANLTADDQLNARANRLKSQARTMRREIADRDDIEALRDELAR